MLIGGENLVKALCKHLNHWGHYSCADMACDFIWWKCNDCILGKEVKININGEFYPLCYVIWSWSNTEGGLYEE